MCRHRVMNIRSRETPRAVRETIDGAYLAGTAQHGQISCPDQIRYALRDAGLRLTRQRIALATLLGQPERQRPITAETLYYDALKAHYSVSRATVCSALRQFERVGLARRVAFPGSKKAWFVVNQRLLGILGSDARVMPQTAPLPSRVRRASGA